MFQLLFLESSELLVLALGNGVQRENFRPVDLMLGGHSVGTVVGCQLQHMIGRTEPMPCWNLAVFNLLQKFAQEGANSMILHNLGKMTASSDMHVG